MAETNHKSSPKPTDKDMPFVFSVLSHLKSPKLETDWDAVAQDMELKNAGVAKVRFGQIRRKHGMATDSLSSPSKAAASKKRKFVKDEDEGSNDEHKEQVKKKRAARPKQSGKVAEVTNETKIKHEEPDGELIQEDFQGEFYLGESFAGGFLDNFRDSVNTYLGDHFGNKD